MPKAKLTPQERKQRYLDKLKQDPQRHEEVKRKERERWARRVEQKKVKRIQDLGPREQRRKRKEWRAAQTKSRKAKKLSERCFPSPPVSPRLEDQEQDVSIENGVKKQDKRSFSGRRQILRKRSETQRKLSKLKDELKLSEKRATRYKVQVSRLKKKLQSLLPNTPRKRVSKLLSTLGRQKADNNVRRHLVYQEALMGELKGKNGFVLVAKKIMKKYRMASWLKSQLGVNIRKCSKENQRKRGKPGLPPPVRGLIVSFFERDDISRQTSGKKETKTYKGLKKQKRYLLDTLKATHKKFSEKHPTLRVSYQSFCRCRPFNVLMPHVDDRSTCACQKCENLKFMANVLISNKVLASGNENLRSIVEKSYKMKDGKVAPEDLTSPMPLEMNDNVNWEVQVKWSQWVNKEIDSKDRRDGTGASFKVRITEKVQKTSSLYDLWGEFTDIFEASGRRHILNSIHQMSVLQEIRANLRQNEAVIHVDFAENWATKYNKEVQSVNFGASRRSCPSQH